MIKTFMLLLSCVVLLAGNPSFAQQLDEETIRFNEADSDSNGTISIEEFKAYVEEKLPDFKQFEKLIEELDEDKDGTISKNEFANRRPATQRLINEEARKAAPVEFDEMFNANYAKKKPLVGEPLGELSAFDEDGNEFEFSSLKGHYTVLNFGCLT